MKRKSSVSLEDKTKRQKREDYARDATILNKDMQLMIFSFVFDSYHPEIKYPAENWKSINLVCKKWNQTARETLIRCVECSETVGSTLSPELGGVGYETCEICEKTICMDCILSDRGGEHITLMCVCNKHRCMACLDYDGWIACSKCDRVKFGDCMTYDKGSNSMHQCSKCEEHYCDDCVISWHIAIAPACPRCKVSIM